MPAPPLTASPVRHHARRVAQQTVALVVGAGLGLVAATMVRDYALLWMVLLPLGLWALANRAGVRSAAGGFDLRRVPPGDLVAMTLGVLLAVPAALAALDGSVPRAAGLVAMLAVLGFGMLGHAGAIRDGATLVTDGRGRVARAADVALRGIRTTSGLTNVYLAAVGTLLAFPDAAAWLPTVAMVVTGALHAVLEGRSQGVVER
ncbi:hypothetical protein H9657_02580 [Cellulomonas sp. Sa3CUA2]|uniref:Uncharacterized protein n=1 Tax=Cellulomonas avistercoris TaxID=2762242 RepID=A0ABR8Q9Q7_9CELL|nr:hypothetical protein [Cellulomonas avistercoris]MBD7917164.1 hypothetical protein [Cellulomonas avistercoris]